LWSGNASHANAASSQTSMFSKRHHWFILYQNLLEFWKLHTTFSCRFREYDPLWCKSYKFTRCYIS